MDFYTHWHGSPFPPLALNTLHTCSRIPIPLAVGFAFHSSVWCKIHLCWRIQTFLSAFHARQRAMPRGDFASKCLKYMERYRKSCCPQISCVYSSALRQAKCTQAHQAHLHHFSIFPLTAQHGETIVRCRSTSVIFKKNQQMSIWNGTSHFQWESTFGTENWKRFHKRETFPSLNVFAVTKQSTLSRHKHLSCDSCAKSTSGSDNFSSCRMLLAVTRGWKKGAATLIQTIPIGRRHAWVEMSSIQTKKQTTLPIP